MNTLNKAMVELEDKISKKIHAHTEEVRELEEQKNELAKQETANSAGADIYRIYKGFINAGFSEQQAWELVTIVVNNNTKTTLF